MDQILTIYFASASPVLGLPVTETKSLAFAPDPAKTAVIVRECFHLAQECIKKNMLFAIRVNEDFVFKNDPNNTLDYRSADLTAAKYNYG